MDGAEPSADVRELLKSPSWELAELPTGHSMFSQPAALAKVFLELG